MSESGTKLLHIADLHFWEVVWNPLRLLNKRFLGNLNVWLRRRHEFLMDRAEAYADYAASLGIPHVLLTGDFSSTSTDAEFARAAAFVKGLERRGLRVILLPGNHDVYTFESVRRGRFEQYFGEYLPEGGYPQRYTLDKEVTLVVAPTVTPNLLSSKGCISPGQIEATCRLIEEAPPGPVLVAGHYPVLPKTHGYHSSPSRRLRNADAFREALGATGRDLLYIAGHVHRFSHTRDEAFPAMSHLTTPAFFLRRPGDTVEGAFSEIHVDAENLRVFQHLCREDVWSRTEEPARP